MPHAPVHARSTRRANPHVDHAPRARAWLARGPRAAREGDDEGAGRPGEREAQAGGRGGARPGGGDVARRAHRAWRRARCDLRGRRRRAARRDQRDVGQRGLHRVLRAAQGDPRVPPQVPDRAEHGDVRGGAAHRGARGRPPRGRLHGRGGGGALRRHARAARDVPQPQGRRADRLLRVPQAVHRRPRDAAGDGADGGLRAVRGGAPRVLERLPPADAAADAARRDARRREGRL